MSIALISDIHANYEALTAVLKDIETQKTDAIYCLGDYVGYGPDPKLCIETLQKISYVFLMGNWDASALDCTKRDWYFGVSAYETLVYSSKNITSKQMEFIRLLPSQFINNNITMVHGSLRSPLYEFLTERDIERLSENIGMLKTKYLFIGHSHHAWFYRESDDHVTLPDLGKPFQISKKGVINVGSVGQPRDGDPRASYVIYNEKQDTFEFRRVPYDIPTTQKKMIDVGYANVQAVRLAFGR